MQMNARWSRKQEPAIESFTWASMENIFKKIHDPQMEIHLFVTLNIISSILTF